MRRVFAALALVAALGLTGCDASDLPVVGDVQKQKQAVEELVQKSGFEVRGLPSYDTQAERWTINVGLKNCTADVKLGGNPGPLTQAPSSLEVVSVAGTPFAELGVGNDASLSAVELLNTPKLVDKLGCSK
jgi:hypothetical protein